MFVPNILNNEIQENLIKFLTPTGQMFLHKVSCSKACFAEMSIVGGQQQ